MLTQWTDRALMTDKSPESKPDAERRGSPRERTRSAVAAPAPARQPGAAGDRPIGDGSPAVAVDRRAHDQAAAAGIAAASPGPAPAGRSATRTCSPSPGPSGWSSTAAPRIPRAGPRGRADFFGIVNAEMTDARLHCEQKMIVFTDREVPLAELGSHGRADVEGRRRAAREVSRRRAMRTLETHRPEGRRSTSP